MFRTSLKSLLCAAAVMSGSLAFAEEAPKLNVGGVEGAGGSIKGTVKITGEKISRGKIDMAADAFCSKAHADGALTEVVVTGDNDALENVLVYVVGKGLAKTPGLNAKPTIDQSGCQYVPHVQAIVAGQEIKILNSDSTLHNVHVTSKNNGEFNDSMPTKGMSKVRTFAKPEAVQFKCDVHPWMTGYVHVMDNPFFAVTQKDGSFEIKGLPAGEYEVKIWHEDYNSKKFSLKAEKDSAKVTVADGKASEQNFSYVAAKKAP